MNKWILWIVVGIIAAAFVAGALFVARSASGGAGENGTPVPSPTPAASTPTVAPGTPTTAPSPTPNASPPTVGTPISVATITIRALENPYRWEPDVIKLVDGKVYEIEVVNDTDTAHWLVEPDYMRLDVYVPPHTKKSVTLKADNTWGSYFVFYCRVHENFSMDGNFIVDTP